MIGRVYGGVIKHINQSDIIFCSVHYLYGIPLEQHYTSHMIHGAVPQMCIHLAMTIDVGGTETPF